MKLTITLDLSEDLMAFLLAIYDATNGKVGVRTSQDSVVTPGIDGARRRSYWHIVLRKGVAVPEWRGDDIFCVRLTETGLRVVETHLNAKPKAA